MDKCGIDRLGCRSQITDSHMIDQVCRLFIILCLIYIGIGSTINNYVNLFFPYKRKNGIQFRNIQFCNVRKDIAFFALAGNPDHLIA